jgi:voltage-gated potassium channel Kch
VSEQATPRADKAAWRRLLVLVAVLSAYVAVVLGAYFALPPAELTFSNIWPAVLLGLLSLGILVGGYVMSLRSIETAQYPLMRSFAILVVLLTAFIVVFSHIYLNMETRNPESLPGLETHLDGLYFTVTMLATVGFGDITPVTQTARAVATAQMVINLVFLGALVRTAMSVGRMERQRRNLQTL